MRPDVKVRQTDNNLLQDEQRILQLLCRNFIPFRHVCLYSE
jgi:hypothetical protein